MAGVCEEKMVHITTLSFVTEWFFAPFLATEYLNAPPKMMHRSTHQCLKYTMVRREYILFLIIRVKKGDKYDV